MCSALPQALVAYARVMDKHNAFLAWRNVDETVISTVCCFCRAQNWGGEPYGTGQEHKQTRESWKRTLHSGLVSWRGQRLVRNSMLSMVQNCSR